VSSLHINMSANYDMAPGAVGHLLDASTQQPLLVWLTGWVASSPTCRQAHHPMHFLGQQQWEWTASVGHGGDLSAADNSPCSVCVAAVAAGHQLSLW
jgi:hypothetical protein